MAPRDRPVSVRAVAADTAGHALAAFARAADRLLDRAGLAPPRLALPGPVLADLRVIFGDSIDPGSVTVRRGHVPRVPHPRAFALPGLVYLGADPGLTDTDPPRATATLVHEFVHLWQGEHVGPRYIAVSLVDQLRLGRAAYDWRTPVTASAPAAWTDLPVEAQAQLVGEAYALGAVPGVPGLVRTAAPPDPAVAAVVADALGTLRGDTGRGRSV